MRNFVRTPLLLVKTCNEIYKTKPQQTSLIFLKGFRCKSNLMNFSRPKRIQKGTITQSTVISFKTSEKKKKEWDDVNAQKKME